MFGCASLPGTDPAALALPLSYLYHYHLAPPALRPRALPERYVDMRMLERAAIDKRAALAQLPPLIKGYLRLGGFVGDGAVIDQQFNTTDVCIIVKTDWVTDKYYRHYGATMRSRARSRSAADGPAAAAAPQDAAAEDPPAELQVGSTYRAVSARCPTSCGRCC